MRKATARANKPIDPVDNAIPTEPPDQIATVPGVLYVIPQNGLLGGAEKSIRAGDLVLPEGSALFESVPLARLTDRDAVAALVRNELREAIPVAEHWDAKANQGSGYVRSSSFLRALGVAASPLVIRIREGRLMLVWA